MSGRVAVVTGANSGIGLETARGLVRQGAHVVLACRSVARGEEAKRALAQDAAQGQGTLEVRELDLGRHASVRAFAASLARDHPRVHVLVNNAGIFIARREATEDGVERTFAVNHLSHFLLTLLLLPQLRAAAPSRIVHVASEASRGGRLRFDDLQGARRWSGLRAYNQSKLANIAFAFALARRLDAQGVASNAMHPGLVATEWARRGGGLVSAAVALVRPVMLSPSQGADTVVWLASSPEVEGITGRYFTRRKPLEPNAQAQDREAQERLWAESLRLTGLRDEEAHMKP